MRWRTDFGLVAPITEKAHSTRGVCLATNAELVSSFFAKFAGLMLRKDLPEGGGMVILSGEPIHMFFMRSGSLSISVESLVLMGFASFLTECSWCRRPPVLLRLIANPHRVLHCLSDRLLDRLGQQGVAGGRVIGRHLVELNLFAAGQDCGELQPAT